MDEDDLVAAWLDTREGGDVLRLRDAVFNEGPNPAYHKQKIRKVKTDCPLLWAAIINLIGEEPPWA